MKKKAEQSSTNVSKLKDAIVSAFKVVNEAKVETDKINAELSKGSDWQKILNIAIMSQLKLREE